MTKPSECVLNCSSEELIRTDAAKHNSQFKEDTCYCVNTNRDEGEESKNKNRNSEGDGICEKKID